MVLLSVIIPTRNRPKLLADALRSILTQSLDHNLYEILVINNGSDEDTRQMISTLNKTYANRIQYLRADEPGLHVGRHLGARHAKGEILTFTDDDIIAQPEWLKAVIESFQDNDIALVGGKNLPEWEAEPPEWTNLFKKRNEYGWFLGYLSLLDFSNNFKEIPARFVFGCNFSIRKTILYECGGFHPDGMPKELIQYRGDGETALSEAIEKKGYRTAYNPRASIYHRVPAKRLQIDYFCQRAFNQGISDSYTEIRANRGLSVPVAKKKTLLRSFPKYILRRLTSFLSDRNEPRRKVPPARAQVNEAYHKGKVFHRKKVSNNPELLNFILKKNYF